MKTIISNTLLIISVLALLWLVLSWLEVIAFNLESDHIYCKYNMFQIMINKGE